MLLRTQDESNRARTRRNREGEMLRLRDFNNFWKFWFCFPILLNLPSRKGQREREREVGTREKRSTFTDRRHAFFFFIIRLFFLFQSFACRLQRTVTVTHTHNRRFGIFFPSSYRSSPSLLLPWASLARLLLVRSRRTDGK